MRSLWGCIYYTVMLKQKTVKIKNRLLYKDKTLDLLILVCKERVKKGISQHCHSKRIFIFYTYFPFNFIITRDTLSKGTPFTTNFMSKILHLFTNIQYICMHSFQFVFKFDPLSFTSHHTSTLKTVFVLVFLCS